MRGQLGRALQKLGQALNKTNNKQKGPRQIAKCAKTRLGKRKPIQDQHYCHVPRQDWANPFRISTIGSACTTPNDEQTTPLTQAQCSPASRRWTVYSLQEQNAAVFAPICLSYCRGVLLCFLPWQSTRHTSSTCSHQDLVSCRWPTSAQRTCLHYRLGKGYSLSPRIFENMRDYHGTQSNAAA